MDNYHEKEIIRLSATEPKSRAELHKYLKEQGLTSEDDFYFLGRPDTPKPWQSISIVTIDIFYRDSAPDWAEEDVQKEDVWDELKVDYLLASLPASFIKMCASICEKLAAQFKLEIELGGKRLETGELQFELSRIADKLTRELDAPGSETLGILIAQSYGG